MTVEVRPGRRDEFAAGLDVWRAAFAAREGRPARPEQEAIHADMIEGLGAFFFLAVEASGPVVGVTLGMHGREDDGAGPPIDGLCHVSMVHVVPDRWGQGIGGQLVDAILAGSRHRDYRTIQLWTQSDNERAQRLYQGCAFTLSGREMVDDFGTHIVHFQRGL